jgi:hypothetical protein
MNLMTKIAAMSEDEYKEYWLMLSERICKDCGSKFDLIKDKYFHKKLSKTKRVLEIVIKTIIPTIREKQIFDRKIICESCNRNDKIKNLGL